MAETDTVPIIEFPDIVETYYEERVGPLYKFVKVGDFDNVDSIESIEIDGRGLHTFVAPYPAIDSKRIERDNAPDIIEAGRDCGAWFGIRHAEEGDTNEQFFRVVDMNRWYVDTDRYRYKKGDVVMRWAAYDIPLIPKEWESRFEIVAHVEDRLPRKVIGGEQFSGHLEARRVHKGTATSEYWFKSTFEKLFYPEEKLEMKTRYENIGLR